MLQLNHKRTDIERGNKGFTLVELIVVLVILAILAAILVPALLGYIDRAKDSQILLNGKNVMTPIQAEAAQGYGSAGDLTFSQWIYHKGSDSNPAGYNAMVNSMAKLADVSSGAQAYFCMAAPSAKASRENHAAWTVYQVIYYEPDSAAYFDGTSWETLDISNGGISVKAEEIKGSAKYKNGEAITEWYWLGK